MPENCIIDAQGRPTTDPKVFYASPPGAILSIAGHKGYGLAVMCEVLAGALTGGGCSNPKNADRVVNGMLSIYLDPAVLPEGPGVHGRDRALHRRGSRVPRRRRRTAKF